MSNTSDDAPPITVALLEDAPGRGPYGAKGIGEPALIPTAAAIRNAVCAALGTEVNHLPLTPPDRAPRVETGLAETGLRL